MLRNSWLKWFENRMHYRRLYGRMGTRRGRTAGQNRPVAVRVGEHLETRTLLTTYFVDTTVDESDGNHDPGDLSLREAIELAEANTGADVIRFAAGLEGEVFNITLGALPTITESLGIFGTIGDAQTINGAGLVINASGAGTVNDFALNSINFNLEPTGAGIDVTADDDGVANVTVFNSQITNSATQGIKFVAHTGGIVNMTLGVVGIFSNGDLVQSEGILGEVGVDPAGAESLTTPGNFATANLDFATLRVGNQFLEGFKLQVEDGGQVTTPSPIRDSTFNDNGAGNQRSGLLFTATDAGSSISASFENVAINNATGHAFDFSASNGANLDTTIIGGTAIGADSDALHYDYNNATGVNTIDGFNGSQAGDNGAEILLFGGSVVSFNQLDNATFNNAVNSGLQVGVLPGSTLAAFNSTGLTASNNGGSGALLTTLSSVSTFVFTDLTTNNNLIRGIQIGENMGGVSTKTFNNVTATGNKLAQAMGIGVGNGAVLNLDVNGGTLTTTGAVPGANAVYAPIRGGSTANLSFDGLSMDNSSSSGIVVDYDQASLGNFDVANTTSTGNQAVGVALFVRGGSNVTGGFDNVDVSSAGQLGPANGIRVDVIGTGANADLTFNNVTANGASGVGVGLLYNAGATGSVNQFDNITALSTGGDGVNVHVRGVNTLLSAFNANVVNASGAGLGTTQSADGLDLSVVGPGAMGTFNLTNVNADGAGGRGVKLQAENTATLEVTMDGFSADSNGLEGVAVDVGTLAAGAQMTGVFANGTASSNGLAFMVNSSGIRTTVTGAGSAASVEFDAASANSNTLDGFSLNADNGADLTADLRNGVAGLGNAQHGVNFLADGAATTASLLSSVPGNNYNGNGGNGVNVLLTNAVTANEITIQGSASTNQGDGINIKSDDATGVTINTLQVTGNNPMLNDNFGNGLVIDLDTVGGLSSLDLSSLTVNDNVGDQVNVSLANMMLQDISFTDISADGPGAGMGNGDGVELTLDNTSVSNSLGLSGITAVENGEDGLQLNFLNGATIPMSSAIDLGTFNNNGQHGVNIRVISSTVTLDLTNSMSDMGSIASMSNNGGNGLNVRLDDASLTMDAIDHQTIENNGGSGVEIQAATPSTFISNNSFTNNTVADNGGFGFRGIFNAGLFDISIGSTTTPDSGNVFLNNAGSAIAIDMIQKTLGQLRIVDNVIAGTNNAPGVFNGEGIFIRQLGTVNPVQATSSLQNLSDPPGSPGLLIQNNRIGVDEMDMPDGNASFGITFQVEEESSINGLQILNNQVSNNGDGGINFARRDAVSVTGFIIGANMIQDNNGDGIAITANNSALAGTLQVTIGEDLDGDAHLRTDIVNWLDTLDGNLITGNVAGIHLDIVTDSQLSVDLNENMIRDNNTGILTTETALSGDTRTLFELIKDEDEDIRRTAIEILNSTKDETAVDTLIRATDDQDWWVRERAVDALAQIGSKKALPKLLEMLGKTGKSDTVVVRALGKIGDANVISQILPMLNRPEREIQVEAIKAISALADENRAETIRNLMLKIKKSEDRTIVNSADKAIKELDAKFSQDVLEENIRAEKVKDGTKTLLLDDDEIEKIMTAHKAMNDTTQSIEIPEAAAELAAAAAPPPSLLDISTLEPGAIIDGRYKFIEKIGKGAFGTVLLMQDQVVDERLILKFLNPNVSSDEEMMKRFVHELRYSRMITHKNVIRIYDFLHLQGAYAISMEYFPSHTLSGEIPDDKGMDFGKALQVFDGHGERYGSGAPGRRYPPRPQARQYPRQRRRAAQDRGLRRRRRCIQWRHAAHQDRLRHRFSEVHGAGADPRQESRRSGRHLQRRCHHVRDGHGHPALQPRRSHVGDVPARAGQGETLPGDPAGNPRRLCRRDRQSHVRRQVQALPDDGRTDRRAERYPGLIRTILDARPGFRPIPPDLNKKCAPAHWYDPRYWAYDTGKPMIFGEIRPDLREFPCPASTHS